MKRLVVEDVGYGPSLVVFLEGVPSDDSIRSEGHEPNGYFWQGIAEFLDADLASKLNFDCEGSMFVAIGDVTLLSRLAEIMEPLFNDPERVTHTIRSAKAAGFEFDD